VRKDNSMQGEDDFYIVNAQERIFKCWATVEILDTQGQIIPIEQMRKVMPMLLTRTVPIHIEHTNKAVGEALNYEFAQNADYGAEGLLVTGKIYKGFPLDDQAWFGIQSGKLRGVSIGGQSSTGKPGTTEWVAPCEIALTSRPSNPGARMVAVAMAKSDNKEYDKESKEHPTLPKETVEQIVEDHKKKDLEKGGAVAEEKPVENKEEEKKEDIPEKKEDVEKAEAKPEQPAAPEAPAKPEAPAAPAAPEAPAKPEENDLTKMMKTFAETQAKDHELLMKVAEKLFGAADVKESEIPPAPPAPAAAPVAKCNQEMGKAAIADMAKSAEPVQPVTATPRPEVKEMQFNPNQKKGDEPSAAEIALGIKKLDTRSFVKKLGAQSA